MTDKTSRKVLRYLPSQRFVHWLGAAGFILLLVTGSVLIWSPQLAIGTCCATRRLHRIGAIMYALWPILYAILNRAGLREMLKESFTFTRDDFAWFKNVIPYFFGRTANLPPQGRVNAGQKLHHISIIVLSIFVGASGLVLLFGAGRMGAANLAMTALVHDVSMVGLTVMLIGHIYFTFLYGGLDAMVKGYVSEEYAQMEHPKWLASLPESAFIVEGGKPTSASAPAAAQTDAKSEPLSEADLPADQATQPKVNTDRP
jgi:formate dehydrogenase subunit gamma